MRLVSQYGNVDLPYENTVLLHNMEYVVAQFDEKEYVMGKYSSEKKAYKVMKMLCDAYAGKLVCQNVDLSDDEVAEIMKNWSMGVITVANSDATRVDYINNIVFQFPKDEEIEVEDE